MSLITDEMVAAGRDALYRRGWRGCLRAMLDVGKLSATALADEIAGDAKACLEAALASRTPPPAVSEVREAVAWRMLLPSGEVLRIQSEPFHDGFAHMMAADCGCTIEPLYALPLPRMAQEASDPVGCAEQDAGRYVYRRIEALMDAQEGTPEAAELEYLATVAETVEEYGAEACGGEDLSVFKPAGSAAT